MTSVSGGSGLFSWERASVDSECGVGKQLLGQLDGRRFCLYTSRLWVLHSVYILAIPLYTFIVGSTGVCADVGHSKVA